MDDLHVASAELLWPRHFYSYFAGQQTEKWSRLLTFTWGVGSGAEFSPRVFFPYLVSPQNDLFQVEAPLHPAPPFRSPPASYCSWKGTATKWNERLESTNLKFLNIHFGYISLVIFIIINKHLVSTFCIPSAVLDNKGTKNWIPSLSWRNSSSLVGRGSGWRRGLGSVRACAKLRTVDTLGTSSEARAWGPGGKEVADENKNPITMGTKRRVRKLKMPQWWAWQDADHLLMRMNRKMLTWRY